MEEAVKLYEIEEFPEPVEVELDEDHKYIGL